MFTKSSHPSKSAGILCRFLLLLCISLPTGCATTSLFVPYPVQLLPLREQMANKEYGQVREQLSRYTNGRDRLLYLLERGRVAQIARDYPASIRDFERAIAIFEQNEAKARITLTGGAAQTSALLTNDNALPYPGEPYERVFVHHFQALNYLFTGDREAALVEIRRANLEQKLALERHERELAEAEERDRERDLAPFSSLQRAAARVKNSFQNAYTFYLSALIYESAGELNDAYIDYRKAWEIHPDNRYLQNDLLRLARRLGFTEEYRQLRETLALGEPREPGPDEGELVILFEQGFVPYKSEVAIPLWVDTHVEQLIAFPTYRIAPHASPRLRIALAGHPLGDTQPIVEVQALAAKALEERLPAMMARQTLRFAAKRELSRTAGKKWGEHAELAMEILNLVTEQADRRSWLTLPENAQIFRHILPAGKQRLNITDGTGTHTVEVTIRPGRITLLHIIDTKGIFHDDWIIM